jgi:translation initiation factor IF-1
MHKIENIILSLFFIIYNNTMVKNTNGGKGAKGLARKLSSSNDNHRLRLSASHDEKYAFVKQMLGNGMCSVITNDNISLICHIRSKFRGRSKRNNFVTKNSVILVGLRDWENPCKNCDLLELYDDNDLVQLKKLPSIDLSLFDSFSINSSSFNDDSIIFSNDIPSISTQFIPSSFDSDFQFDFHDI